MQLKFSIKNYSTNDCIYPITLNKCINDKRKFNVSKTNSIKNLEIKLFHIWNEQPNRFTCKLEDYFYTKRLIALDRWASVLIHHILDEQLYFRMHVDLDHLKKKMYFLMKFFFSCCSIALQILLLFFLEWN